jgi:hypothetical protein
MRFDNRPFISKNARPSGKTEGPWEWKRISYALTALVGLYPDRPK